MIKGWSSVTYLRKQTWFDGFHNTWWSSDGQAMVKRWSSGDQTMLARRSHSLRSSCETSRQRRKRELLGGNQEITLWALNSPERRFIIILWRLCTTTAQLKRQKRMEQEFEGKHWAGHGGCISFKFTMFILQSPWHSCQHWPPSKTLIWNLWIQFILEK